MVYSPLTDGTVSLKPVPSFRGTANSAIELRRIGDWLSQCVTCLAPASHHRLGASRSPSICIHTTTKYDVRFGVQLKRGTFQARSGLRMIYRGWRSDIRYETVTTCRLRSRKSQAVSLAKSPSSILRLCRILELWTVQHESIPSYQNAICDCPTVIQRSRGSFTLQASKFSPPARNFCDAYPLHGNHKTSRYW